MRLPRPARATFGCVIAFVLTGCYNYPTARTDQLTERSELRVRFATPIDLTSEQAPGDTVLLQGVRELRGRVVRVEHDSVWLRTTRSTGGVTVGFPADRASIGVKQPDTARTVLAVLGIASAVILLALALTFDFGEGSY